MTRDKLVFDWTGSESRFFDKMVAFVVVTLIFTFFIGAFNIRLEPASEVNAKSASIIRFNSDELSRRWLLVAEEGGPFPGRLEIAGGLTGAGDSLETMVGDPFLGDGYRVSLAGMEVDSGVAREELAATGIRVFPEARVKDEALPPVGEGEVGDEKQPVLTPFDQSALGWMPESLPLFQPAEGADTSGSPWRFAVVLRGDGTIRDCIPLGGGEGGIEEISSWLRGVKFGVGEEERWLGLRVELINRRDDGSGDQ